MRISDVSRSRSVPTRRRPGSLLVAWAALLLVAAQARAELNIEITQGQQRALPIAIVPFSADAPAAPVALHQVIADDLQRSGWFEVLDPARLVSRPGPEDAIDFREWRLLNQEALVVGRRAPAADGSHTVDYALFDVTRDERLLGQRYGGVASGELRRLGHHMADQIFERLTGIRGVFNTRIAYVIKSGEQYELQVADADGHNAVTVLRAQEPVLSPTWSADGEYLAYATFDGRQAVIYRQHVASGARKRLVSQPGINGAPAFSPDGGRLALTLSRDGNPEIYVLDIGSGGLRRLTNHYAIDTEPTWSPDGRWIYFTSDRGGGPQIYRVAAQGGALSRMTWEGGYNARASVSPDGKQLAFVHGGKGYRIAVLDLETEQMRIVTDGPQNESPSFAPNGRMIIYTTRSGGRDVLATVSLDGDVRQRLVVSDRQVREPSWSPFSNLR